jgi:hypothetical protein
MNAFLWVGLYYQEQQFKAISFKFFVFKVKDEEEEDRPS